MPDTSLDSLEFDVSHARQRVDEALERYASLDEGCPEILGDAIRYALLSPGKRIRPLLVWMANEACGGDPEIAIPAACAVEMVHTYSLVHDDLPAMDDDQLRRGLPTCHVKYGEATAILVGDALIPMAFRAMAEDLPAEMAGECCRLLAIASGPTNLVGGQADDLVGKDFNEPSIAHSHSESNGHLGAEPAGVEFAIEETQRMALAHLEHIHARKTGAMLTVSLLLGGVTARATEEQLEWLKQYGKNLGLAFQIVDDLLDCQGDWTKMGKMTQKDEQRGKLTYPKVLGIDQSKRLAEQLIDEACSVLEPFGAAAQPLVSMARFVLERNQ